MKVVLYTTHCPRCEVLRKKLEQKKIEYNEVTSMDEILEKGIMNVPMLSIDDCAPIDFTKAIQWINQLEV